MKHELVLENFYDNETYENSVVFNEKDFPSYPEPSTSLLSSNPIVTVGPNTTKKCTGNFNSTGSNLNWKFFVDGSHRQQTTENPDSGIYDALPTESHKIYRQNSKQMLTLDLIPSKNDRLMESSEKTSPIISNQTMSVSPHIKNHTSGNITSTGTSSSIQRNVTTTAANQIAGPSNQSMSISNQTATVAITTSNFQIGLYGWRKKCLYLLIFALMLLIVINLALTLWILKVMEFSTEGMGQLKIVAGGLQLSGQTLVMDLLRASTIRSRHGQPILFESSRNFSINTRDWEGRIDNHLFLGHDRLEVLAHSFKIIDPRGAVVFAADKNEVAIGANSLRVEGEGGAIFRESVQTPLIKAEPGRELKFESSTRSLHLMAGQDILIKSGAGSIDASCLNDLHLYSEAGNIRLDSGNILMPNLKIASLTSGGDPLGQQHKIYQLCVCSNGKLFLAPSHSVCAGDESTVCR